MFLRRGSCFSPSPRVALRAQCRAAGLSPAGGKEALAERLAAFLAENDFGLPAQPYGQPPPSPLPDATSSAAANKARNASSVDFLFGAPEEPPKPAPTPTPSHYDDYPPPPPSAVPQDDKAIVNAMQLPDLRMELRSRGLSPAGSRATLQERLMSALAGGAPDTAFTGGYSNGGANATGLNMPSDESAPPPRTGHPGAAGHQSQLSYLFGNE